MLIDVRFHRDGGFYDLINLDTGLKIDEHIIWADDEAGTYGVGIFDEFGMGSIIIKTGNIKLVKHADYDEQNFDET